MLVLGGMLMIVGSVLLALHHRVLATCFLDVVVPTILPKGSPMVESHDFPWGTMVFGHMDGDFTKVIMGFVALGLAQCLLLPLALKGAAKGVEKSTGRTSRVLLVLAGLAGLLAAGTFALMTLNIRSAFNFMASSGAADPQSFGEDMPVILSHFFMFFAIIVQCLIFCAACAGAMRDQSARWLKSLPCLIPSLLFTIVMVWIKFGPVDAMIRLLADSATADPAHLAGRISLILNLDFLAAVLLAASAVAILVLPLVGGRPKALP
ncbi:MAG TPA: hypothetical protein VFY13_02090 [Luteolibacter sp.]|nr:hypothetical protein [Luteolibacter sp.]